MAASTVDIPPGLALRKLSLYVPHDVQALISSLLRDGNIAMGCDAHRALDYGQFLKTQEQMLEGLSLRTLDPDRTPYYGVREQLLTASFGYCHMLTAPLLCLREGARRLPTGEYRFFNEETLHLRGDHMEFGFRVIQPESGPAQLDLVPMEGYLIADGDPAYLVVDAMRRSSI